VSPLRSFSSRPTLATKANAPPAARNEKVSLTESSAEVRLLVPKFYAVIEQRPEKIRKLHTSGDAIFHPQNPNQSLIIQRIDEHALIYRESHTGKIGSLRVKQPVPGLTGLVFTQSVLLSQLEYRYKVVDRIRQADPVLVLLSGSRAVLEKQILPVSPSFLHATPPQPEPETSERKIDPTLFERIRVKETAENTYLVDGTTVKPIIENVGKVFASLNPMVSPSFSSTTGINMKITSAVGEGILSTGGFLVTNIKVAQTFGIMIGDIVKSINGYPVDSVRNAWWIYQELLVRNPGLSDLRVEIQRGASLLTKIYKIR